MPNLQSLASTAAERLRASGETIAVAESSTGGLISAALLSVAGASAWYKGGVVIYTLDSRRDWLDMSRDDVAGLKPLTEEMAAFFADRVRERRDSTWGITELGAAGPTGTPYGIGAGVSALAVTGPKTATRLIDTGSNDREQNMWAFTTAALELLAETLNP